MRIYWDGSELAPWIYFKDSILGVWYFSLKDKDLYHSSGSCPGGPSLVVNRFCRFCGKEIPPSVELLLRQKALER